MQLGYKRNNYCEIDIFTYLDHVKSNLSHSLSLKSVSNLITNYTSLYFILFRFITFYLYHIWYIQLFYKALMFDRNYIRNNWNEIMI